MKNNTCIFFFLFSFLFLWAQGQNNTVSPYSRYGLGELAQNTFAHNAGMGGAHIALKPDSTMPIFINAGNPAAYSLIRLTTLEVGGRFTYSNFKGPTASLRTWGGNFAYGALGFPIRTNGGACFGIMPYSFVGYQTESKSPIEGIGDVSSQFNGNGGLNKAFIGYGIMPFNKRLSRFRTKRLFIPDSVKTLSRSQYKSREFGNKILSDLSLGLNVNYIFGSFQNTTRVIYPDASLYNNTYRERNVGMGDFTGNLGLQSAVTIDSIKDPKKREAIIKHEMDELQALNIYTPEELLRKRDSLNKNTPSYKRAFKEKVKITFGLFASVQNPLKVTYNTAAYSYVLGTLGQEILRDTILKQPDQTGYITLPMEQGIGLGFKKGERFNLVVDFAITDWRSFKYLTSANEFVNNYRSAIGLNFVPEKYAAGRGAFFRKINYRLGLSYQTGYIKIQNSVMTDYFVSAGVGLPVGIGRLSSMVNISAQYGQMGSPNPALLKQNYYRINFGFTFCDKWFQKFRYD